MSAALLVDRDGSAWTFTLSRPEKRNALSSELVEALIDGVGEAQRSNAEVLIFRGEGKNFSAGFDFADLEAQSEGDLLLRFVRIETLLQTIAASPCLTVALAHGRNFGAGVDLVAVCRQRVASTDASFRMPGLKFGLVLGSRRFAEIVGPTRAASVLQQARTFDAAEALAMGFVSALAETSDWPQSIATARESAGALDRSARAALYAALRSDHHRDADLAALVCSASRPGLKARIAAYRAAPER